MRTRAAVLHELHAPWSVEEIELDPPKAGEVLVKLKASGMCHSDEHVVTGDLAGAAPDRRWSAATRAPVSSWRSARA